MVLGRGITVGRPLGLLLTRREGMRPQPGAYRYREPGRGTRELTSLSLLWVFRMVLKAHQVKDGAILLDVGVSALRTRRPAKEALRRRLPGGCAEGILGFSEPRRCGSDDPRELLVERG